MKRIAIVGPGGAGKSTLSRKLGKLLNLPVYHLDILFWKEMWTETPKEEWQKIEDEIISKESWVIDGNFSKTQEKRFQRADIIIFLDFPKYILFWRVFKRRIKYHNKVRPDIGGNNKERINRDFLKWVWNYKSEKVLKNLKTYASGKEVYILKNPKAVRTFLKQIKDKQKIA